LLFREQFAPQTRIGRGCMMVFLTLGSSGLGISAALGYQMARHEAVEVVFLLVALMGTVVTIAFAQIFSHQLWQQRPWRNNRPKRGDE
jgi:hypothetical protein